MSTPTRTNADNQPHSGNAVGSAAEDTARVARAGRVVPHPAPTFWQSVWLVATREIMARLRSKAFLISTGILLFAAIASVVAGGLVSANPTLTRVAVVGSASEVVESTKSFEVVEAADVAAAEKLVRSGDVSAAIIPTEPTPTSPLTVSVIALDSPPSDVLGALSVSPELTLLEPTEQGGGLAALVAIAFGVVFFLSAMTFGSTIAQSVVEEKQTRVVEILMSAIPVRALLAGKIVGNSILAFGQILAIGVLVAAGMAITGQRVLLADIGPAIVWFAIFFVVGFVLLAAMYAATASMVSRQEDVGSVTAPVMTLVMLPYLLVVFFQDNPTVLAIMSYVPFSAPVGMPVRIFAGTAEWWEPLLSLLILVVTTLVVIVLASRIYSNSLLRMGTRVSYREALRA